MRYLLVLVSFMAVLGCGKGPNNIPPEIQGIYYEFLKDADFHGHHVDKEESLTIEFAEELDSTDAAECFGDSRIVLLRSFWIKQDDESKKAILYHELGHCLLGRKHTLDPVSIMQPFAAQSYTALHDHKDEALRELFQ